MNPQTEVSDLLSILLPPTRLRIWLHTVFADKATKGQEVPDDFVKWLGVVERVCGDLPSDIDSVTPDQWAWIESKIFSKRPQQAELFTVAEPVKIVAY